jgi:hypothetical protein
MKRKERIMALNESDNKIKIPAEKQRKALLEYELGIININKTKNKEDKIVVMPDQSILDSPEAMQEIIFNLGYTYYLWASDKLKINQSWVLHLIKKYPEMYPILETAMKEDIGIAFEALQKYENLGHLSSNVLIHKEVAYRAVKKSSDMYLKLNDELQHDADLIAKILQQDEYNVEDVPSDVFSNKTLLLEIYQKGGPVPLKKLSGDLLNDDEIIVAALNVDIDNIALAPDNIKSDKKWAKLAVQKDFNNLRLFPELQADKPFILDNLNSKTRAMDFVNPVLLDDKEVIDYAMNVNANLYRYMSNRLKHHDKYIYQVLDEHLENLQYLPEEIKNNKAFILSLVEKYEKIGRYFKYISPYFADDEDVTNKMLDSDASAYEYLSERLKKAPQNIIKTLSVMGSLLNKVPADVRNNWNYVRLAIENQPGAIQYADERFKKDIKMALRIIKKSPYAFTFMDQSIKRNLPILIYALQAEPDIIQLPDMLSEEWKKRIPINEPNPARFIKSWLLHEKLEKDILNNDEDMPKIKI